VDGRSVAKSKKSKKEEAGSSKQEAKRERVKNSIPHEFGTLAG
jgi:hypothetical protein